MKLVGPVECMVEV